MSWEDRHVPVGLVRRDDGGVEITWKDGGTSLVEGPLLRRSCPCASCVDEWTGEVRIRPEQCEGVGIAGMKQVGNYAFSVTFSDGHDTGIFTFRRLRGLADGGSADDVEET